MRNKILFLAAILMFCQFAPGQVLNVQSTVQEQDQWCWAAVSSCVLKYYNHPVAQCTVAEYARLHCTWNDFGDTNCCQSANYGCNYWNYNYGYAGSIQTILQNWNVQNYGYSDALTLTTAGQEISGHRPFIIRWGWATGGGHFIVGYGLSGTTLYYMNPWPGEGLKYSEFSWVASNGDHTWTHTNILTTSPSEVDPVDDIPGNLKLYPNPASGELVVETPVNKTLAGTTCEITGLEGSVLQKYFLETGKSTFDIKALPPGFYLVKVNSGDKIFIAKFIKQ